MFWQDKITVILSFLGVSIFVVIAIRAIVIHVEEGIRRPLLERVEAMETLNKKLLGVIGAYVTLYGDLSAMDMAKVKLIIASKSRQ